MPLTRNGRRTSTLRRLALLAVATTMIGASAPDASYGPFTAKRISDHVRVLASDAFEGRGPGTPGEDKTVAYLIDQFKRMGLKPGGTDGGWTQTVNIARLSHDGPVTGAVRLAGDVIPLANERDIAVNSQVAGGKVAVAAAPLVFVGYGIDAPEIGWNDFKDVDLRGKVAVVIQGEPTGEPFGGPDVSRNGLGTAKTANLLKRGAIGLLNIAPDAAGAWESRANSTLVPQYGALVPPASLTFTGFVREGVAHDLFQRARLDFAALQAQAQTPNFRPVALADARLDLSFAINRQPVMTRNVLGRIPGTTRPNETVMITAHWDHLGRGRPDATGDDIYNGAIDNAAGVAGLLELARVSARAPRPQRSLTFMATTGEELGFWGVRYYVEHPIYPLATTVVDINLDTASMLGPTRTAQVMGWGKTTLDDNEVVKFAKAQGRNVNRTPGYGGNYYNRADSIIFSREGGVPTLYLSWGGEPIDPRQADNYIANFYHTPKDEWRPDMDFRGAAQNLQLLYWIAQDLANSRRWPEWLDGSQGQKLRAQSAAARLP